MENIILTNNKDLRLVSVKVGVLSTLRFELPLVSASATHVEVIVTSGTVHSAYTATFIPETKRWQCDIAASQFPEVGKQSYEVAYVLDGKQFWDGKGWIEIEDATTSGIEPQPRPEPYRYTVLSVNGYGADSQGAVRIPKTLIATNSPTTTEGYMEGDIYFNRETGATWTLCDVQGTLTWVLNKGVMTVDPTVTRNSQNPVSGGGVWSAIWGALASLPTGISSLYDWCVAQLAGKIPNTRKVNGKALSSDVELDADDVGAYPATDAENGEYESDKDLYVNGRTRGEHVQARSPSDDTDWCDVATLLHIADEFDPQEQYAKDALVTFRENENWKLYKCVAANGHTGNWNPNDFQEATVEDVLAALRTDKQDALTAQQLANIAAVPSKANNADVVHKTGAETIAGVKAFSGGIVMASELMLDYNALKFGGIDEVYAAIGNDHDEVIFRYNGNAVLLKVGNGGTLAFTANIPYTLTTKTIDNGAVTLDDRAMNAVAVSSALASLTINFPTATSGKVRDFGLRLSVASGITTAPELVLPQGITFENADGEVPEIGADGAATILYFTETASGVFLVKGEVVTAIS